MKLERVLVPGLALAAALSLVGCTGLAVGPDLRLRGPASLSGRVTVAGTDHPVAGAVVEVHGAGAIQSAVTGADGRYALRVVWEKGEEIAAGEPVLMARVDAAGYRGVTLGVRLAPRAVTRDFALGRRT